MLYNVFLKQKGIVGRMKINPTTAKLLRGGPTLAPVAGKNRATKTIRLSRRHCIAKHVPFTGVVRAWGYGWALNLHHHHDVREPITGPATRPRHDPVAEARANRDRRAKAEEFGFWLHGVDHFGSTHPLLFRRSQSSRESVSRGLVAADLCCVRFLIAAVLSSNDPGIRRIHLSCIAGFQDGPERL